MERLGENGREIVGEIVGEIEGKIEGKILELHKSGGLRGEIKGEENNFFFLCFFPLTLTRTPALFLAELKVSTSIISHSFLRAEKSIPSWKKGQKYAK